MDLQAWQSMATGMPTGMATGIHGEGGAEDCGGLPSQEGHRHDTSTTSVGIREVGELDMKKLNEWIGKLLKDKDTDIYRMKGVLAISGMKRNSCFRAFTWCLTGNQWT